MTVPTLRGRPGEGPGDGLGIPFRTHNEETGDIVLATNVVALALAAPAWSEGLRYLDLWGCLSRRGTAGGYRRLMS